MKFCLKKSAAVNNSRHKSRPKEYQKSPRLLDTKWFKAKQAFASEFLMRKEGTFSLSNLWGKG